MSDQFPEAPQPDFLPHPMQEMPMDMRRQRLAIAVATEVARGGRVESQNDTSAMIVTGSKPNHTLHLMLTIFTCTLWAPVWLIIAFAQGEHRVSVQIDPYGQALRQQLS